MRGRNGMAEEKLVNGCPPATQDISINLKNRAIAVKKANYGPLNPNLANAEFWQAKADLFKTSPAVAKKSRCSNCAAFIVIPKMQDCIVKGLGDEPGNMSAQIVRKANLGYCEIFDFKCAGDRTCDAWVVNGPIRG